MGRAVTGVGDNCSGHGCFPPRPATAGSPNVYVNGKALVREGDPYATHCCGTSCHPSVLAQGSGSIEVNGRQAGRIGDPIACGSVVAIGSTNVFIGE